MRAPLYGIDMGIILYTMYIHLRKVGNPLLPKSQTCKNDALMMINDDSINDTSIYHAWVQTPS